LPEDRVTAVKEHGVPKENVALPREESLLLESFGFSGNPIVVSLGGRHIAGMQVGLRIIIELGKPW